MAKSYRPVLRDQGFLLPPDMREWLPADHLVWFLMDTVEVLDTGEFDRRRRGGVGAAGYDPRMLLGLLVYAYCRGVRSSRQIERLCVTDVAYRVLCAQDVPDHSTIARFRAECQDAFTGLFRQVLLIEGGHDDPGDTCQRQRPAPGPSRPKRKGSRCPGRPGQLRNGRHRRDQDMRERLDRRQPGQRLAH